MKQRMAALLAAAILFSQRPAVAQVVDTAQGLHDFKACVQAPLGRAPRDTCERAYAAFATAKAQLRLALSQSEGDASAMRSLNQMVGSITGDYGVELTPREALVTLATWQYVVAMTLGESGLMRKSPTDPEVHNDFVRALHAGDQVLSSPLDSSIVRRLKALVRMKWHDVQGFANWAQK